LNFSGSLIPNRVSTDLLADYFGMAADSVASISFHPRIQNFIADFNLYVGFDELINGLYFRVHAPLAWSKWSLRAGQKGEGCLGCSTDFIAGYMNRILTLPVGTPAAADVILAGEGVTPVSTLALALDGQTSFGDKTRNWEFGRFELGKCSDRSQWRVADVDMILGWNFWHCDDYHVGIYAQAVAPTGTKIDAKHQHRVFSPIIGNGKHWEFGGGISAHAQLLSGEDTKTLTLYFEGSITHMLKNKQVRSFDFADAGAMSRYMLLKEFNTETKEYTGNLVNAIDFATRCTSVRVDVKGEAAVKLVYSSCNWNMGLGYDFYGISKEKVCIGKTASNLPVGTNSYGFKGITAVDALGYSIVAATNTTATTPAASYSIANGHGLGTTQSIATINRGVKRSSSDNAVALYTPVVGTTIPGFIYVYPEFNQTIASTANGINPAGGIAIEGPQMLFPDYESATLNPALAITQAGVVSGIIDDPALLTNTSADFNTHSGAAARQIISKVFGTLGYRWNDCDWKPFLDLGAEVDLARHKDCCSAKQWGLWVKGGISF